jgi:hypothetical protein
VHLGGRNFVRDLEAGTKSFVDFRRAEEMESQLVTASAINLKDRRTGKTRIRFEQAQWLTILPKRRQEPVGLFPRKLDHAHLRDHYRPTENRSNREQKQDHFPGDGRVFEGKNEPTRREEAGENQIRHPGLVIAKITAKKNNCRVLNDIICGDTSSAGSPPH